MKTKHTRSAKMVYRVRCWDGNSGGTVQVLAWTVNGLQPDSVRREAAKMTGCHRKQCVIERCDSLM
jgi:hypothetical protein